MTTRPSRARPLRYALPDVPGSELWSINQRERYGRARVRELVLAHVPHEALCPDPEQGATVNAIAKATGLNRPRVTGILTSCVKAGILRRDLVEVTGKYGRESSPRYRVPAPARPAETAPAMGPAALYRLERARREERLKRQSAAVIAEARELLAADLQRAQENRGARRGRPKKGQRAPILEDADLELS